MSFDTLKLPQSLRERARMPPETAKGDARAIVDAVQGDLAIRGELMAVKSEPMAGNSGFQTVVGLSALVAIVHH